jgi:hypothetical protein
VLSTIATGHIKLPPLAAMHREARGSYLHLPVLIQEVRQHGAERSLGVFERRVVCNADSLVEDHVVQYTARGTGRINTKTLEDSK